jgi:hypothetical protein
VFARARQLGRECYAFGRTVGFSNDRMVEGVRQALSANKLFHRELAEAARDWVLQHGGLCRGNFDGLPSSWEAYRSPDDQLVLEFSFWGSQFRTGIREFPASIVAPLFGDLLAVEYGFTRHQSFAEGELKLGNLEIQKVSRVNSPQAFSREASHGVEWFALTPGTVTLHVYVNGSTTSPAIYLPPGLYLAQRTSANFLKRHYLLSFLRDADPHFHRRFSEWLSSLSAAEQVRHFVQLVESDANAGLVERYLSALTDTSEVAPLRAMLVRVADAIRERQSIDESVIHDPNARQILALLPSIGLGERLTKFVMREHPTRPAAEQILSWVRHIVLRSCLSASRASALLLEARAAVGVGQTPEVTGGY